MQVQVCIGGNTQTFDRNQIKRILLTERETTERLARGVSLSERQQTLNLRVLANPEVDLILNPIPRLRSFPLSVLQENVQQIQQTRWPVLRKSCQVRHRFFCRGCLPESKDRGPSQLLILIEAGGHRAPRDAAG
jgi:hypothetical protein